jgi:nucleolar protein 4
MDSEEGKPLKLCDIYRKSNQNLLPLLEQPNAPTEDRKPPNGDFNRNQRKGKFRPKQENVKRGRLIIRNLSFKTTEDTLKKEFSKFGEITEVNILKKPDGKLVGCAFVQYKNYGDSVNAIKNMHGKDFLKRKVTVDFAVSKNRYTNSHPAQAEVKNEDGEEEKPEMKDEPEVKEEPDVKEEDSDEDDDSEVEDEDEDEKMSDDGEEKIVPVKNEKRSSEEDNEFTVFIKNISFDTTNEDLQECFKKFGPIKYALTVRDPVSGHSKGTGFVRFLKKESVSLCLQQTGLITLQNFTLEIYPTLTRQKVKSLETEKTKKEPKDGRNIYLTREGMVIAGSSAAEGVSATDMAQRLRLEQIKNSMLKNLNRFISRERLTIHNLPDHYDDGKMRKMVVAKTGLKPIECRVMRENKPSPAFPKGKPKGFGFLSFKKHEDALAVLRKLNNNPEVFSANRRPIVSFSIEDKNVLNIKERRQKRSLENNPTYQKKLEKKKQKRAKKLKDKKDKKPVTKPQPKTPETAESQQEPAEFSGFAAKPGELAKHRGTFKLKEQSKIHEKSMQDRNKKNRREKQKAEAKKDKDEKLENRTTKKRKLDADTNDSLTKMIDKYKTMIQGAPEAKKSKTRGKWFMD